MTIAVAPEPDDNLTDEATGTDGKTYRITNHRERHGDGIVQSSTAAHRHTVVSDDVVAGIERSSITAGRITITAEQWAQANKYDPVTRSYDRSGDR